ncbi:peptidyl-prolyl cis-trans isomerase sig-7 [Pogonomyrmex barbatus]|uniref:Peptidyl-prolyl cis-trans isomerase n=1 Tax=Pogonomyrmex barbatus TaxID=144034 RepID=A0A6I9W9B7_9HYME|nr:peptidyl-prolyl cis-trans isomerase sig-7 [Pogonomyrmex barbatus]
MAVVVETTIGDFTVDLYIEERPQTTRNFLKLCKLKYYNWNLFHSVQTNFIAQTGDPTGTGKGGESVYGIVLGEKARYYEAEQMPKIKHSRIGLLSMVNCGNNMLGSQFFITLGSELQSLDNEHCVFGEITEGLEVILKFNETICDGDQRPYQDIRISHTVILEDPFDDPVGFVIPDRSPEPTKEALMSDRIGADEAIDDTGGMTAEEIAEMQKDKEAKARATILEIVGDIPDADIAPPENVLFVCKLNPVTNDDDLEIIFSRFGKIIGCEVIRDHQTGDSLQYAFIEFADRKSCEDAYFKMDNVLIDDRRIHVDFSQSVAKMRWRGKGKGIKYLDEDDKKKREENYPSSKKSEASRGRDYDNGKNREEGRKRENDKDHTSEHRKHDRRREDKDNRDRRKEDRSYDDHYEKSKYDSERKDRRRREERRDRDRNSERRGHSEDRSERRRRGQSEERLERRGRKDEHGDRERRHRDNEKKRSVDDEDDMRYRDRSHKHKRKR